MNPKKILEKCIATTALTVVADAFGKKMKCRLSFDPLDEAWGNVGLPNRIRVLVEEGGSNYPWGNWVAGLDELAYGIPSDGPYQTNPPSIEDIISSIRIDREGQVRRIRHEEEIDVLEYQILTREIVSTLKPLEEIIRENVFCLGSYVLYDRVMNPLAAQLERKPRRDRGTRRGRPSTSSSTFDQPSSSHLNDDDDDGNDEGTSRASTPSPIRYVNSLTNQVPQVFQNPPNIDPHLEPFYTRQTEIINRQVQLRDEQRGGVRSIGKSLRRLWRNMKK
ncbi:hypothetical protein Tco_0768210 [Tanacetum coccineum]